MLMQFEVLEMSDCCDAENIHHLVEKGFLLLFCLLDLYELRNRNVVTYARKFWNCIAV